MRWWVLGLSLYGSIVATQPDGWAGDFSEKEQLLLELRRLTDPDSVEAHIDRLREVQSEPSSKTFLTALAYRALTLEAAAPRERVVRLRRKLAFVWAGSLANLSGPHEETLDYLWGEALAALGDAEERAIRPHYQKLGDDPVGFQTAAEFLELLAFTHGVDELRVSQVERLASRTLSEASISPPAEFAREKAEILTDLANTVSKAFKTCPDSAGHECKKSIGTSRCEGRLRVFRSGWLRRGFGGG